MLGLYGERLLFISQPHSKLNNAYCNIQDAFNLFMHAQLAAMVLY